MPRKVEFAESINFDTLLRVNASFDPKNFSLKERENVPGTGKKKIVVPAGLTATILTACAPTPYTTVITETFQTQQNETTQKTVDDLISPQNQFWQEFKNINPDSPLTLSQEKNFVDQNGEIIYAITPIIKENNQKTPLSLVTINNSNNTLALAAEFVTTLPSNLNNATLNQFKGQDIFGLYFLPEDNLEKLKKGEQLTLEPYFNYSDIFYGFVLKSGIRYEDFAKMIANAKTQEELVKIFSEDITHQLTRDPNTGELKVTEYVINNQQQTVGIKAIINPSTPATSTPTPIPTETPTPIPQIEVNGVKVPDPKVTNPELFNLTKKDAPIPQFVNALNNAGIEITPEQVLQGLTYKLAEFPKEKFTIGFYTLSNNESYILFYLDESGKWQSMTPKDLKKMYGISIGISGGLGDNIASKLAGEFSSFTDTGAFMEETIHSWPPDSYLIPILKRYPDLSTKFHALFFNDWPSDVESYMLHRFDDFFRYLDQLRGRETTIVLANEPLWCWEGTCGWQNSALYEKWGDQWISIATRRFIEEAEKRGFLYGNDYNIMLLNQYGIGTPSSYSEFVKEEISKNVSQLGNYQWRLGIQFHIGKTTYREDNGGYIRENPDWLADPNNIPTLIEHFKQLSAAVNGPIYITELDFYDVETYKQSIILRNILEAAIKSGVVKEINFWSIQAGTIDPATGKPMNPNLITPNGDYTINYYTLFRSYFNLKS